MDNAKIASELVAVAKELTNTNKKASRNNLTWEIYDVGSDMIHLYAEDYNGQRDELFADIRNIVSPALDAVLAPFRVEVDSANHKPSSGGSIHLYISLRPTDIDERGVQQAVKKFLR